VRSATLKCRRSRCFDARRASSTSRNAGHHTTSQRDVCRDANQSAPPEWWRSTRQCHLCALYAGALTDHSAQSRPHLASPLSMSARGTFRWINGRLARESSLQEAIGYPSLHNRGRASGLILNVIAEHVGERHRRRCRALRRRRRNTPAGRERRQVGCARRRDAQRKCAGIDRQ
jgi:hypothetical protein